MAVTILHGKNPIGAHSRGAFTGTDGEIIRGDRLMHSAGGTVLNLMNRQVFAAGCVAAGSEEVLIYDPTPAWKLLFTKVGQYLESCLESDGRSLFEEYW